MVWTGEGLPGAARRGQRPAGSAPLPPDHGGVLLHRGFQQPLQDGPFPHRCASGGGRQRLGSTGHVPAPGPSPGRTSRLEAIAPIKEVNNFFKKSTSPLSLLLYLKEGSEERNPSAPRLMGQLARPGERARTSRAVRGGGAPVRQFLPAGESLRAPLAPGLGPGKVRTAAPRLALQRAPGAPALRPARPGRSARSCLPGSGIRGRRL